MRTSSDRTTTGSGVEYTVTTVLQSPQSSSVTPRDPRLKVSKWWSGLDYIWQAQQKNSSLVDICSAIRGLPNRWQLNATVLEHIGTTKLNYTTLKSDASGARICNKFSESPTTHTTILARNVRWL